MTKGSREILKRIQKEDETMLIKLGEIYVDATSIEAVAPADKSDATIKARGYKTCIYMKHRATASECFGTAEAIDSVVQTVNKALKKGSRKSPGK